MNAPLKPDPFWEYQAQISRYEAALATIRDNPHGISDRDTVQRMQQIARNALKGE